VQNVTKYSGSSLWKIRSSRSGRFGKPSRDLLGGTIDNPLLRDRANVATGLLALPEPGEGGWPVFGHVAQRGGYKFCKETRPTGTWLQCWHLVVATGLWPVFGHVAQRRGYSSAAATTISYRLASPATREAGPDPVVPLLLQSD
jgi:hypothetical protein